jgi:hypothetical protein
MKTDTLTSLWSDNDLLWCLRLRLKIVHHGFPFILSTFDYLPLATSTPLAHNLPLPTLWSSVCPPPLRTDERVGIEHRRSRFLTPRNGNRHTKTSGESRKASRGREGVDGDAGMAWDRGLIASGSRGL